MITSSGVEKDYNDIVRDEKQDGLGKLLSVFRLVLKLMVNIRTNTALPESEKARLFEEAKKKQTEQNTKKEVGK
jgi:hypothetical protein